MKQHTGAWCFDEIQQAIAEFLTDKTMFLKQVNSDAQTSKTAITALNRPDFPRSIEYSDRKCFEPASAVDAARIESTATGNYPTLIGHTAVEQKLTALADRLKSLLSHWLKQLQTTMQNKTSARARESLQQQLQQLIKALSTWSSQLRQEVSLQQQLLDSMQQLEEKLDDWNVD